MPMTQADLRDCIAPELKEFGMRRRGFRWFWSGPEVRWSLHLAKIPRREWVSYRADWPPKIPGLRHHRPGEDFNCTCTLRTGTSTRT